MTNSNQQLPVYKRLLFLAITLVMSLTLVVALSETMVRFISPQDLSGTWRTVGERGLWINRANWNARHQLGNRVVEYRFNSLHLRGPEIQPGVPKVLVLGDSYTFGWLLEEHDTYISRIQELANKTFGPNEVQFINAAAGGWGTADQLAFLEAYGATIDPDIVLVFLNTDDIGRSLKSPLYACKDRESLELEAYQAPPSSRLSLANMPAYPWLMEHSHLLQFARRIRKVQLHRRKMEAYPVKSAIAESHGVIVPDSKELRVDPAISQALGQALFRQINHWCRTNESQLLVTTTGFHFGQEDDLHEPTRAFMKIAAATFDAEGIPYKDISPHVYTDMNGNPQAFIIPDDGHPNEAANRIIAIHAWDWLRGKVQATLELNETKNLTVSR